MVKIELDFLTFLRYRRMRDSRKLRSYARAVTQVAQKAGSKEAKRCFYGGGGGVSEIIFS